MVRIGGSYLGFAQAFKAVVDYYSWKHFVLLSDDDTAAICWFGAKAVDQIFAKDDNYTYTWLRLGSAPTDEQLDDVLWEIRSRTRGRPPVTLLKRKYIFSALQRYVQHDIPQKIKTVRWIHQHDSGI